MLLIPVISKGVFLAKSVKSINKSFAFSQLQSIVVNATVACCKFQARVITHPAIFLNQATIHNQANHFDNVEKDD